jgi:hypothetical protein
MEEHPPPYYQIRNQKPNKRGDYNLFRPLWSDEQSNRTSQWDLFQDQYPLDNELQSLALKGMQLSRQPNDALTGKLGNTASVPTWSLKIANSEKKFNCTLSTQHPASTPHCPKNEGPFQT